MTAHHDRDVILLHLAPSSCIENEQVHEPYARAGGASKDAQEWEAIQALAHEVTHQ